MRGIVHSLATTDAAQADITQPSALLHGEETTPYEDKAYWKGDDQAYWEASGARYRVNQSGKRGAKWDRINAARSRVRARVAHPFHVVKRLWHFTKVRYRGPAKNTARAFTEFALANLYQLRNRLAHQGTSCRRERRGSGAMPGSPRSWRRATGQLPCSRHRRAGATPNATQHLFTPRCSEVPKTIRLVESQRSAPKRPFLRTSQPTPRAEFAP